MTKKEIYQMIDDFLYEKFADQYNGLDDDFPDAHSDWLNNLDAEEMQEYAAEFIYNNFNLKEK